MINAVRRAARSLAARRSRSRPVLGVGALDRDRFVGRRDLTVWTTSAGRALSGLARRGARWLGPHALLAALLASGAAFSTAMTVASVEIYDAVDDGDGIASIDRPVLELAQTLRTPEANALATAFTDLGGPVGMPVIATVATAVLALTRSSWTPVVLMAAAAAGSLLMTVVGKSLVGRIRPSLAEAVPPYESSASFPSGHSLNAVVVAGVLGYLLITHQRRWSTRVATIAAAAVFAVAMGLSRVFLGHHWLTDVLVAWSLGLGWLTLVLVAHRLYLTVSARGDADGGVTQTTSGDADG